MKLYTSVFAILFSFLSFKIIAQPTLEITKFPKNNQLIPRNPATNIGTYNVEGSTLRASNITLLQVKVSKDDVLERNYSVNVPTNVEKFIFNIPIQIKAELKNYHIELTGMRNNQEIVLAKADNVVAGDVFIVNGQSNCIGRAETVDLNPFMRSYSDQFGWTDIDYTSPSKWGPRMARRIIEKEQIPVAIFCEAVGGVKQTWFMRQAVNPYTEGNYGILYSRLKKAEVEKNVRALLWWQGESDGWETPLDSFKIQFKILCNQWKEDYNTPIFYFQIRFKACTHVKPDIFEAQRQLATEIPNIEIMSSNPALSHDGCHFMYLNGYDAIGEQAYNLLGAKLYNRSSVNTRPPNIVEAFFSATNEITIKMRNATGNLRTIGTPWADFKLEGCSAKITGGFVADYRIKLNFTGDTTGLTGVSYVCHIDSFSQNWVVNPLGVGILLFYNVPINKRQLTDTASIPQNTEGVQFSIYPTIVDEFINIRFVRPDNKNKRIAIVNAIGQIVFEKNMGNDLDAAQIPVSGLPKGLYFIGLNMDNQGFNRSSGVQKFIHL